MTKIVFLIGPVSSGKSTVAKFFKNSISLNIDDFYEKHLEKAKDFEASYRDKKFQDKCWNSFYSEIRKNKLKNKLTTAQTTSLNPRFNIILNKLKRILSDFTKEIENLESLIDNKSFEEILNISSVFYESIFKLVKKI